MTTASKYLRDLNPVQRDAVKSIDGPVMIVAGAGSGKTRVLTYRIAYLLSCGVPPYNILALTFTNKAALEMRERIGQLVDGGDARRIWMGTFHATFARLLRRDAERLGFRKNFSIYDTDDSQNLIKTIMADLGINTQQLPPSAVRHAISSSKNRLRTAADVARAAVELVDRKVSEVFAEYEKRLMRANAMDFDDLIIHPIRLLDEHPDVLETYRKQFRFILIDEYQDTNRAQYEVVRRIADAHRNICVVGDDAQSIYAFRGADIRNILEFEKNYGEARVFRLEQNYRSTAMILKAADAVIKNNPRQIPKTLWTDNAAGDPVTILETADETDEAQRIVYLMQEESRRKKLQLKDFAVLYRTNAQSRTMEDAFRRSGIPYTIVGGVEFYRRKEIKDVLAYLRVIVNPSDDEATLRVINFPLRGIGATTVARLREYAAETGMSFFDAATRAGEAPGLNSAVQKRIGEFTHLVRKYASLRGEMSAGELAGSLVDELGLIAEYKSEGTVEARARIDNIQELLSAIADAQSENGQPTLETFLAEASLVSDTDRMDPDRNAVTLMTLHSAKGLEFPVVFIVGMEEGLFPSGMAIERDEVEEERRLCYVGMTRAMRKLFMTYARSRMKWGERMEQMPSRFLDEVCAEASQRETTRRRTHPGSGIHTAAQPRSKSGNGSAHNARRAKNSASEYDQTGHESYSQTGDEFAVGSTVLHATFGRGTVMSLHGMGDAGRVVVLFDAVGKKTLVLKYAGLRLC